jgi:hypothetical protein
VHKQAPPHAMLYCLLQLPLSLQNFNHELQTIINIATNNGYNNNLVHRISRKKQKAFTVNRISFQLGRQTEFKWCLLPFLGGISYKIYNPLPTLLKAAFNPTSTSDKLQVNGEDKALKSRMWQLKCNALLLHGVC